MAATTGLAGCHRNFQARWPEARAGEVEVNLRPVPGFLKKHEAGLGVPFFQSVPLPRGEFFAPGEGIGVFSGKVSLVLDANVVAHWPDGSAQWVSLTGVWPPDIPLTATTPVRLGSAVPAPVAPACFVVCSNTAGIAIGRTDGKRMAVLHPELSALRIIRPKAPDSRDPEDLDRVVQYAWAEEQEKLNPESGPLQLVPTVTEFLVEEETPSSILYRVRGNGGRDAPGCDLEWQLRVRVFRHTPIIRFQMTWWVHWDPEAFALTAAKWVATLDEPLVSVAGAGPEFALRDGAFSMCSSPAGRSRIMHGDQHRIDAEWPERRWHTWVAEHHAGALGLGIHDFTRLGPNRLTVSAEGIDLACWDGRSGLGLDLRSTVARDEFGMNDADFDTTARGVARTVEMVWAVHQDRRAAEALAQAEISRDGLWFASREDLIRSQALGPWRDGIVDVDRRRGQVHWVMASRDYWRWNGFINFGDIRTNWGRQEYEDGRLHPMRWGLNGRYGWRHGSGEPYGKFLTFGLWAEDRKINLFAYDYARHVADVDVMHGRFGHPLEDLQGGMHRRNKNHWSGSVQMQYTPSRGLYLMKWLTGWERFDDTLAEIRDFALRRGGDSVYGASAWLSRYTESGDPADLEVAKELLDRVVRAWEKRNQDREPYRDLRGLAALHAGNFRLYHDWWPVQIEFHRATDDPVYLDVLADRATALPRYPGYSYFYLMSYAYLISQGFPAEHIDDVGRQQIRSLRESRQYRTSEDKEAVNYDDWSYELLEKEHTLSASLSLASFCGYLPLIQSWLYGDEAEIHD